MKERTKRSRIWFCLSDAEFIELFHKVDSVSEMLRIIGCTSEEGGNRRIFKQRCSHLKLDYEEKVSTSHKILMKKLHNRKRRPYEELFCENSTAERGIVRKRIIKENLIPYFCNVCGQPPYWNNKPMSLILDHINGVRNDHRLENLQWVCGNCNMQLDTFGSKNIKRVK